MRMRKNDFEQEGILLAAHLKLLEKSLAITLIGVPSFCPCGLTERQHILRLMEGLEALMLGLRGEFSLWTRLVNGPDIWIAEKAFKALPATPQRRQKIVEHLQRGCATTVPLPANVDCVY
jgi:hypothetical protein